MCQSLQPRALLCSALLSMRPALPFLQSPQFAARVTEEYVYIAETDHLMLRPLPNLATRCVLRP